MTDRSSGTEDRKPGRHSLQGTPVFSGIAIGRVFLLHRQVEGLVERRIHTDATEDELARLDSALASTREQIKALQRRLPEGDPLADTTILDAHLMVLEDHAFLEEVRSETRRRLCNIEIAVRDVAKRYIDVLEGLEDSYLRDRGADIKDVVRRLVQNLIGGASAIAADFGGPVIVVSEDLEPSETVSLPREQTLGFAIDEGSTTSHTALLARALEIPAVVALHDLSTRVSTGDWILLDGYRGIVTINPSEAEIAEGRDLDESRKQIARGLGCLHDKTATTKDGHRINLLANLEDSSEVTAMQQYGAEGIGLFRTEYLWLAHKRDISEEEQRAVYCDTAERVAPKPVVIRTLDLGGDKPYAGLHPKSARNAFLGLRSTRFLLRQPELFKRQLRAILAASCYPNVSLMYPMISDVSELVDCNRILCECMQELDFEGVAFNRDVRVGVMIEVPSAALTVEALAPHVSFLCLGTNDLIQYTLAADRINDDVSYLYDPTHPAVLTLIRMTIAAGRKHGIPVSCCGEMASDPMLTALLLGMGINELSVAPVSVPMVKNVVRHLRMSDAHQLSIAVADCMTSGGVKDYCREMLSRVAPAVFDLIA